MRLKSRPFSLKSTLTHIVSRELCGHLYQTQGGVFTFSVLATSISLLKQMTLKYVALVYKKSELCLL